MSPIPTNMRGQGIPLDFDDGAFPEAPKVQYAYALNKSDKFVHISQAKRRTLYKCHKCGHRMVPHKGPIKPHHFQHMDESKVRDPQSVERRKPDQKYHNDVRDRIYATLRDGRLPFRVQVWCNEVRHTKTVDLKEGLYYIDREVEYVPGTRTDVLTKGLDGADPITRAIEVVNKHRLSEAAYDAYNAYRGTARERIQVLTVFPANQSSWRKECGGFGRWVDVFGSCAVCSPPVLEGDPKEQECEYIPPEAPHTAEPSQPRPKAAESEYAGRPSNLKSGGAPTVTSTPAYSEWDLIRMKAEDILRESAANPSKIVRITRSDYEFLKSLAKSVVLTESRAGKYQLDIVPDGESVL